MIRRFSGMVEQYCDFTPFLRKKVPDSFKEKMDNGKTNGDLSGAQIPKPARLSCSW